MGRPMFFFEYSPPKPYTQNPKGWSQTCEDDRLEPREEHTSALWGLGIRARW